ncbi:MAG TPA: tRNA (adenosine(37)-N6)-threonylcarbamoyltransferase complex dimerization subunit type 1 TsaB [Acidimicrobiales bacterium]|nr:tRNA (adenosine(37)-N6)-threonylcarbamoyltransferase complex dimerization subunit type 1 TsaB [Acidimicrobiales bacterium]
MRFLAIESASACVGCALWADGGPVASFALDAGARHSEVLMPAIDHLFRSAAWAPADIDGVAVDVGPGLFTGLRVGLATAGAVAAARSLPIAGVSSLRALAHPHRHRRGLVAAVVDAKRGEVFWSIYRSDGDGLEEVSPPAVAPPGDVVEHLAGLAGPAEVCLAAGDGAWRYRAQLESAGIVVAGPVEAWPSPLAVAELGARALAAAVTGAPLPPPRPLYLREADVRIGWERVDGRVVGDARGSWLAAPGAGCNPA